MSKQNPEAPLSPSNKSQLIADSFAAYVNGTLTPDEMLTVDRRLLNDPTWQREWELLWELYHLPESIWGIAVEAKRRNLKHKRRVAEKRKESRDQTPPLFDMTAPQG